MAIEWDLQFGGQLEFLEDLADEGRMPAALETRPVLPEWVEPVREAFWLLVQGCWVTGGDMTPTRLQPTNPRDAIAIADVFGFDSLYFLRVIQPAIGLYREHLTARLRRG